MNFESVSPFLLIVAPFFIAFLLEAFVIYFFKVKLFWVAVGFAFLINFLSLTVLYGSSLLLGKLGYEFNGMQLPLQVMLFLWWLSILTDGLLLQLFIKKGQRKRLYLCSILMNTLSYLFLFFFITNTH